jgi:hypothetical protein
MTFNNQNDKEFFPHIHFTTQSIKDNNCTSILITSKIHDSYYFWQKKNLYYQQKTSYVAVLINPIYNSCVIEDG